MPGFNVGNIQTQSCGPQTIDNKTVYDSTIAQGSQSNLRNTIETARKNRFELSFNTQVLGLAANTISLPPTISLACLSIDRPIIHVEKERVWNGADYINVPLRVTYDTITAVLYEVLRDGDTSQRPISNWTMESIVSWWVNSAFNTKHSRSSHPEARRVTTFITMKNGAGDSIWAYKLHNCWPEIITPDNLSYKSSDIVTTAVALNFDKVEEATNF